MLSQLCQIYSYRYIIVFTIQLRNLWKLLVNLQSHESLQNSCRGRDIHLHCSMVSVGAQSCRQSSFFSVLRKVNMDLSNAEKNRIRKYELAQKCLNVSRSCRNISDHYSLRPGASIRTRGPFLESPETFRVT